MPRGGVFQVGTVGVGLRRSFTWKILELQGDNRLPYFDVNDFDEPFLAPASWDLVRFLTSLWVGADMRQ